jgi:hypothetical protein
MPPDPNQRGVTARLVKATVAIYAAVIGGLGLVGVREATRERIPGPCAAVSRTVTPPELRDAQALAGDRGKFWPNGSAVLVEFLGGSAEVQARTLRELNAWAEFANIDFVQVGAGQGWIRISYDQPGYWSMIGTDALYARPGEPTLNLEGFDRWYFPDSEWRRVVRHEGGHAIGFIHEHERPELLARLNRPAVIQFYWQTQHWTQDRTVEQVFTPPPGDIVGSPADQRSIMAYNFPPWLTLDGKGIAGGDDFSSLDRLFAAQVYPGRGSPSPN